MKMKMLQKVSQLPKTLLLMSSSKFFTEHAQTHFEKPLTEAKIAYITTAVKGVSDRSYLDRSIKCMREAGLNFEEIDIEGKKKFELREILKDKDIIYVAGGNTFYLLNAARESGFDSLVKELVERGVLYVGASAGSYIACPTIEMATWKHQDVYGHYGVDDLNGLNLVPFLVTAHYTPEYELIIREKMKTSKYPVKILTDEQALLVVGDDVKLIGEKEIKLESLS